MLNVAFGHCLYGQAPFCFTSDKKMKRTVAYCLQFSSPSFLKRAYLLLLLLLLLGVLAKSEWTETRTPQEAEPPPYHVAESKRLSACVSHSAAALCVCVSDSRTATYCVVLVFAF